MGGPPPPVVKSKKDWRGPGELYAESLVNSIGLNVGEAGECIEVDAYGE